MKMNLIYYFILIPVVFYTAFALCSTRQTDQKGATTSGWCCIGGEVIQGSAHGCEVLAGSYYYDKSVAEKNCKRAIKFSGYCCVENVLNKSTAEECHNRKGEFYGSRYEAQLQCKKERERKQDMESPTPFKRLSIYTAHPPISIDDVSPGPGSQPQSLPYSSLWGKITAITGTERIKVIGIVASWTTPLQSDSSVTAEHLAVLNDNHDLVVFFHVPGNGWKEINLTEKTNRKAAGPPMAWTNRSGRVQEEHIAISDENAEFLVYSWKPGSEWKVEDISSKLGQKAVGPAIYWSSPGGCQGIINLATIAPNGNLIIFSSASEGVWKVTDVSQKTGQMLGAPPAGWQINNNNQITQYLAGPSDNDELLVFSQETSGQWKFQNVTKITHQKIIGFITSWQIQNTEYIAGGSPDKDLMIFSRQPGSEWKVENISAKLGQKITGPPRSWQTLNGNLIVEHLVAPGPDGKLLEFSRQLNAEWKLTDIVAITGKPVNSIATYWSVQKNSLLIENLAATDSAGNLYAFSRQTGGTWKTTNITNAAGRRILYATSPFGGAWRSSDYGDTWFQLVRFQPSGDSDAIDSLHSTVIMDIVSSPLNSDIVLAGTDDDIHKNSDAGIYRSVDGGISWSIVYRPRWADGKPSKVTQIRFAPDDPQILYASVGNGIAVSIDGGSQWKDITLPGNAPLWHIAIGSRESDGSRKLYGCGESKLWYSPDNGNSWFEDNTISKIIKQSGADAQICEEPSADSGTAPQIMELEPGHSNHLFLAVTNSSNKSLHASMNVVPDQKESIHNERAYLYFADFSRFKPGSHPIQSAAWMKLPVPSPVPENNMQGGRIYLKVQSADSGYLLFFSDGIHVYVSSGKPGLNAWHRLDGPYDTATGRAQGNIMSMHGNPQNILVSSDFNLTLKKSSGIDSVNNLDKCSEGRIWLANNGGLVRSNDCGTTWDIPYEGPRTLYPVNIAGIAQSGKPPALYMGTKSNDDFLSLDGGATWKSPKGICGDCGYWFADPVIPASVTEIDPESNALFIYTNPSGDYPDTMDDTNTIKILYPPHALFTLRDGARPMILTASAKAQTNAKNDFITIKESANSSKQLLRTVPSSNGFTWRQAGPDLPPGCSIYQASGGTEHTTYYIGDGTSLWKSSLKAKNDIEKWVQIVPQDNSTSVANPQENEKASPHSAYRFFVNPYDPNLIYIIDANAVMRSDDGGTTWKIDSKLDNVLTANGEFNYQCKAEKCILNDLIFDYRDSRKRFAVGLAGIFYTLDGVQWNRLVDSGAMPCRPVSAYFDGVSHAEDQSLYVACYGRGLLRIHPL